MKMTVIILIIMLNGCMTGSKTQIPNPDNFEIVSSCLGDINNDKENELVVVYNTNDENAWGKARILRIYKINKDKYILWKESLYALRRSKENGVNDNRVNIRIDNGLLKITNEQISNWKLEETNIYNFVDNQFKLIEYNSKYGRDCNYWITINYTSSDCKLIFNKVYENCNDSPLKKESEHEELFLKDLNLNLMNRTKNYIEFTTPKYQYDWNI